MAEADPKPLFVLHGAEGEYVLQPLAAAVRQRGFECEERVARVACDERAKVFALAARPGPKVLVTCAHFLHDSASMEEFLGVKGVLSPIEVRGLLAPVLTVYVPHDLCAPLLTGEIPYLSAVDLYLGALDSEKMFRLYTDVEIVGWIRHVAPEPDGEDYAGRALWLFSDAESSCHRDGVDATFERILPFMRSWCALKFAPTAVNDALAERLRERHLRVLDSSIPPTHAVRGFDCVVSNGESSVVREAALMGKPTYVLTHPRIFPSRQRYRMRQFADLENLHFVPTLDAIPQEVRPAPSQLRPFDAERAVAAILARLPR
jgi:hypothetical protein